MVLTQPRALASQLPGQGESGAEQGQPGAAGSCTAGMWAGRRKACPLHTLAVTLQGRGDLVALKLEGPS